VFVIAAQAELFLDMHRGRPEVKGNHKSEKY
jgi:hypothetical protein